MRQENEHSFWGGNFDMKDWSDFVENRRSMQLYYKNNDAEAQSGTAKDMANPRLQPRSKQEAFQR